MSILSQTETHESSNSKFKVLKNSIIAVLLEDALQEGEIHFV